MTNTPETPESPTPTTAPVIEFEVDPEGTLRMRGYKEAKTRTEFYEHVSSHWSESPQALEAAMAECPPLAWAVQSIYSDFRHELSADIRQLQQTETTNQEHVARIQARLISMPEDPEDGIQSWLISLTSQEFNEFVLPKLGEWFDAAPDWRFEGDYLTHTVTAQGAAMAFFQQMAADQREALGVILIDGEHPGSSYHAAELRVEVDQANLEAVNAGIPVRFIDLKH